ALRIYNTVTMTRGAPSQHVHPPIVSDAAHRFFKQARRRAFLFSCSIQENIPRSRGLGSSATIRLGILIGLNQLTGNPLDQLTIFRLCAELEVHPDNAAPAIFWRFHCSDWVIAVRRPEATRHLYHWLRRSPCCAAFRSFAQVAFRVIRSRTCDSNLGIA